jgi:hypothetical protein
MARLSASHFPLRFHRHRALFYASTVEELLATIESAAEAKSYELKPREQLRGPQGPSNT